MTIEAVLNEARRIDRSRRAAMWSACGTHHACDLRVADAAQGAPWLYCPACWTAFDATGCYPVNPPASARNAPPSEAARRAWFAVIANCEDEFSVWPLLLELPSGWRLAGPIGTADQCIRYIERIDSETRTPELRRFLESATILP